MFFICNHPEEIQTLNRLRLGLGHLGEDEFKDTFQDTLNSTCKCGEDTEFLC